MTKTARRKPRRALLPNPHEASGVVDLPAEGAGSAQTDIDTDAGPGDRAPMRRCIVTRQSRPVDDLVRFARAPDGAVVPDLRGRLPGRGAWVTAKRDTVAEAARRKLFGRAFRADSRAPEDLAETVGMLIRKAALQRLGLERKAGRLAVGFSETDARLRAGRAAMVLHASDAAPDGVRKLDQAAHAGTTAGGEPPYICRAFNSAEMSLALGRGNVIHAALEKGGASDAVIARCRRVERYFGGIEPAERVKPAELAGRTE
ncbi:RNA-binding protein [Microbaculum marinum]|uniref:RNA-binding protein n=1 Tax=Microbaculum marinum TaxID=1764581 RepID=A0AAW9RUT1_9HYPH